MTKEASFKKNDEVKFTGAGGKTYRGTYQRKIMPTGEGRGYYVRALVRVGGIEYKPALSSLKAAK